MNFNFDELLAKHPLPFTLHDIQVEDIITCIGLDRVGMFLPVGYGKTVISTMVALAWGDQHRIVCVPPILVKQWVKWINSIPNSGGAVGYGVRTGKDGVARPQSPAQRRDVDLHAYSWWIMSYGIFKNDLQYLLSMLKGRTYTTLVDEAQGLKNTSSKLFKNVEMFSAGRHLALLTGTELNNPGDAYAYIRLKTPSIYRSRAHFDNMHVEERDFFDKPVRWMGLDVLNRNLYLSSVQRTKEEVHKHLPQPNYQIIEYDLDPAHKRMYDELAEQLILETEAGGKIDGTTPGKLRNALQQLVINWPLFAENPTLRPSFLDLLDTVMDEIDVQQVTSSKLIVWTWFKNTTRYITDYLNEIGVPAVAAYSEANSRKSVDLFMDNPEIRALVAQPGSAGAGLNPQHICWECVFAEVPTRSIPFRQSAGRIDREGQRFRPNIRIATAAGTVQGQMYRDLLRNDGMVQQVQGNAFDLRALVYSSATT
jgi:hypothetical protein